MRSERGSVADIRFLDGSDVTCVRSEAREAARNKKMVSEKNQNYKKKRALVVKSRLRPGQSMYFATTHERQGEC